MKKNQEKIKKIIKEVKERITLNEEELSEINSNAKKIISLLRESIKKNKVIAEVFVGGSVAKKTVIKSGIIDVDLYLRFKDNKEMKKFEKVVKGIKKEHKMIHGSRDYYRIKEGTIVYEIIPVLRISSPKKAENVTDLSYYHVNYVLGKIRKNKNLAGEIAIAKDYCKALGVYGAESYVKGFSGYSLELLIIKYGTFNKMINELIKEKKKIVIDEEKHYKNDDEAMVMMNEAKLESPIILVDPTYKERNALAALSEETFKKFVEETKKFLNNPRKEFFEKKEINKEELKKEAKKKNAEYTEIIISTNKQEGDIAGTKMLKYSKYLIAEISKSRKIIKNEFVYDKGKTSKLHIISKKIPTIIINGPPIKMIQALENFRKKHDKVMIKKGRAYVETKNDKNAKETINGLLKERKKDTKGMGITKVVLK